MAHHGASVGDMRFRRLRDMPWNYVNLRVESTFIANLPTDTITDSDVFRNPKDVFVLVLFPSLPHTLSSPSA